MGEIIELEPPKGGNGQRPQPQKQTPDQIFAQGVKSRYDAWLDELLGYYKSMKEWPWEDAMDVFQEMAAYSARASEMRAMLGPTEDKKGQQFRIKIIDPFIEECDRQFRTHSRLQAVREMDARLAGGRFA